MSFIRSINNRPELFFLERFIKKGYLIADLKFNIDDGNVYFQSRLMNSKYYNQSKYEMPFNNVIPEPAPP